METLSLAIQSYKELIEVFLCCESFCKTLVHSARLDDFSAFPGDGIINFPLST